MVVLFGLCVAPLGLGRETTVQDSAKLASVRQRAEQGDARGQSELGLAYEYGSGAAQRDYGEAIRWYRKTAEQGDSLARHQLGRI
jgi:TPR repeat protein